MTYDEALALLPPAYAQAIRLKDRGSDEQQIAAELAVEPAAAGPLLQLASAKLARLLATSEPGDTPPDAATGVPAALADG